MFKKQVLDVLQQINGITNSVILKHPVTVAIAESNDMMIYVDISKLDNDYFPEIGLNDSLNEFINLFKLFPEERTVEIKENTINVSYEKMSSSYIMDNVALMDAYNRDPDQFIKTEEAPSVAVFDLSVSDIKSIKAASGVFKDLSEVILKSQDGDMTLSLGNTNSFNQRSNTFTISKESRTTKEFEIKITADNFKNIPVSDYEVQVKYNSAKNSYRVFMKNKTFDGIKIFMTVKI